MMRMIVKDGAGQKDVDFESNVKRIIAEYTQVSKMVTSGEIPASLQDLLNAFADHASDDAIHVTGLESAQLSSAYQHSITHHFDLGVEYFTLTATDISNKHVLLSGLPASRSVAHDDQGNNLIMLLCEAAPFLMRSIDYCQNDINPQMIEWGSLMLEDILQEGDNIVIFYEKE